MYIERNETVKLWSFIFLVHSLTATLNIRLIPAEAKITF